MAEKAHRSLAERGTAAVGEKQQDAAILTIEEVMARLSLSRAQVYRKVKEGNLKATKQDAALAFLENDVLAAVTAQDEQRQAVAGWLREFAGRLAEQGVADLTDPDEQDEDAALAELAHRLLLDALVSRASDIYMIPVPDGDRLLVRKDGRVHEVGHLGSVLGSSLRAKLKALAPLPQADTDQVNEAIFSHTHGERSAQVRLSVVPTLAGEQIHLQLWHWHAGTSLDLLGYSQPQGAALQRLLTSRPGLVILAGSHDRIADEQRLAIAHYLGTRGRFSVSIDRRLHFRSENIVPLAVEGGDGPSFADQWQAALRLCPDVILLDTVQDQIETRALVAAVAAGVTVITQVPTATSSAALEHLVELGLDRGELARYLLVVSEQRLLPRLCPACRVPRPCTEQEAMLLGVATATPLFEAAGCDHCESGHRGSRTVHGLLVADDTLAAALRTEEPLPTALGSRRFSPALDLAAALRAAVLVGEVALEHVQPLLHETTAGLPVPTAGDPAAADRGRNQA